MSKTFIFQAIQFNQTIHFSISMHFSSIWPIDRILSGATTPGQSGPGSDGSERVLCIPQSSRNTGISPSDCLVSYLGHSLGGGFIPLQRCSQCILQSQLIGQKLHAVVRLQFWSLMRVWCYLIIVITFWFSLIWNGNTCLDPI